MILPFLSHFRQQSNTSQISRILLNLPDMLKGRNFTAINFAIFDRLGYSPGLVTFFSDCLTGFPPFTAGLCKSSFRPLLGPAPRANQQPARLYHLSEDRGQFARFLALLSEESSRN
jgi:hypothetical protein